MAVKKAALAVMLLVAACGTGSTTGGRPGYFATACPDSPQFPGHGMFDATTALHTFLSECGCSIPLATVDDSADGRALRAMLAVAPSSIVHTLSTPGGPAAYLAALRPTCAGYLFPCSRRDPPLAAGAVLTAVCSGPVPAAANPWLAACASWPVAKAATTPVHSSVPVLLLRGALDPTSPAPGPADLSGLAHAVVVTFPGIGVHPLTTACAFAIRTAFLADPDRAADSACTQRA